VDEGSIRELHGREDRQSVLPEINQAVVPLCELPGSLRHDRTRGTNAIRQHLDNLDEAGSPAWGDHLSEG
jgi:hypothetical protein